MGIKALYSTFRSLTEVYQAKQLNSTWRERNRHNQTTFSTNNPIRLARVTVGRATYGHIRIFTYCPEQTDERLSIGSFVSIAEEVRFLLGGNHQTKTATTYPLRSLFAGATDPADACSRGPIVVEDEVWIGLGSTILSGVTLSYGSVVAAGSVVTTNVPPCEIWGGAPARRIGTRPIQQAYLAGVHVPLAHFEKDHLLEHCDDFYRDIVKSGLEQESER